MPREKLKEMISRRNGLHVKCQGQVEEDRNMSIGLGHFEDLCQNSNQCNSEGKGSSSRQLLESKVLGLWGQFYLVGPW